MRRSAALLAFCGTAAVCMLLSGLSTAKSQSESGQATGAWSRYKQMKRYSLRLLATAMFVLLSSVPPLLGQGEDRAPPFVEAQGLFEKNCSTCHTTAASAAERAPARQTLMKLTPEAIFSALNSVMGAQAKDLNDRQKRLLAEFLGGRPLGSTQAGDAKVMPNRCPASPPLSDPSGGPA